MGRTLIYAKPANIRSQFAKRVGILHAVRDLLLCSPCCLPFGGLFKVYNAESFSIQERVCSLTLVLFFDPLPNSSECGDGFFLRRFF